MRRSTKARDPLVAFALALALYLPLASLTFFQNVDTDAAATPAWVFVRSGTTDVSDVALLDGRFYFPRGDGIYSDRFPGVVLYATPFYLLARILGIDHVWGPGAVAGSTVAAASVALMFVLLSRVLPSRPLTWSATLFFAFGTATWSVSADAQWPHGINQLLITAGILGLASNRLALSGLAMGMTVFVRPQMAPGILATGVSVLLHRRSWKALAVFGSPALLGTVALVVYHGVVLGRWRVGNGHTTYAAGADLSGALLDLPRNLLGTVVDPSRGILWLYPGIVVAALGLHATWPTAPPWVKSSAVGGAFVLTTQLALNRYSGGESFFGSRLTIEALTLAYPLLASAWLRAPQLARRIGIPLLAWSVVVHALGAVGYPYLAAGVLPFIPTVGVTTLLAIAGFIVARAVAAQLDQRLEPREVRRDP